MSDATDTLAAHAAALSPAELFLQADGIVKTIIVLLALASVVTWAIVVEKWLRLRRAARAADRWVETVQSPGGLKALADALKEEPEDPFARVHAAVIHEWSETVGNGLHRSESGRDSLKERLARVGQIASGVEFEKLQRRLQVLATVGSVGPFVGLFGTVWGIMNSFQGIAASNNTSLAVVAPGIAEALFATALGLVAAIPAVIAYNRLAGDLGVYGQRVATLLGLIEVKLSRQLEAELVGVPIDTGRAARNEAATRNAAPVAVANAALKGA
ncbi:MotA/TolQ/ExbB proton channel family protein [Derxia gummosa]|uniref:MotA/TolQ/ExbB proton channel family protein n=1 Tax=Derxia gummosa DSM 723 TaxID=1121388 RepID=A0A8B6XB91_9BURK|nr:MotA/TolQ/ExbB proton channel family protein [Derxia gummosa]